MLISLSVNNLQPNPNNPEDTFSQIAKTMIERAILTKAMWFIGIFDAMYFLFILTYSKIPSLSNNISLIQSDIRDSFWLVIITSVVLIIVFAIAEIVINFKYGRGLNK